MDTRNNRLLVDVMTVPTAVDMLGVTKAGIAEQKDMEDHLKAKLIDAAANGDKGRVFEGQAFRVTVSFTDKPIVSWAEFASTLALEGGISEDRYTAIKARFTKVAEQVPVVRVCARKGV